VDGTPHHPSVAKCWYGDTQRAVRSLGGYLPSHQRDDTRCSGASLDMRASLLATLCYSAPHVGQLECMVITSLRSSNFDFVFILWMEWSGVRSALYIFSLPSWEEKFCRVASVDTQRRYDTGIRNKSGPGFTLTFSFPLTKVLRTLYLFVSSLSYFDRILLYFELTRVLVFQRRDVSWTE
jgi:hypothetical protein